MRLALSTALLVIDSEPSAAVEELSAAFRALDLPVIRAGREAFAGTGLEAKLESEGILTLIVCGTAPEATVRDAEGLGFRAFAAGDADAMAEVAAALEDLMRRRAAGRR